MHSLLQKHSWLLLFVPLIVTLIVYLPILQAGFIWDDRDFIINWSAIHSFEHVGELVRGAQPKGHEGGYRPLRNSIMMVSYHLYHTNPFWYHLQGVVVHLINVSLVFGIALLISKKRSVASITSVLFGIHPAMIEPIAFITASFDSIGIMFAFAAYLGFLLYLTKRIQHSQWMYRYMPVAIVVMALCAFLTYEFTYILPVLMIFTSRYRTYKKNTVVLMGTLFLLLLIVYGIRAAVILPGSDIRLPNHNIDSTFFLMMKFFREYILLIVLPFQQSVVHEFGQGLSTMFITTSGFAAQKLTDQKTMEGIAVLVLFFIVAYSMRKKAPIVWVGMRWFLIGLLPVSNIFPTGGTFAERYIYFPSLGIFLAVGWLIVKLFSKVTHIQLRQLSYFGIIIVCSIVGLKTMSRLSVWKTELLFWKTAAQEHPNNDDVRNNLGLGYLQEGNLDAALREYLEAQKLDPTDPTGFYNASKILQIGKNWNQAYIFAQQAVILDPSQVSYRENLAGLEARRSKVKKL